MNRNTYKYLIGVALGYLGMIMYTLSLIGYENVYIGDVIDILKQAVLPFLFSVLWVVLGVEGLRNIYESIVNSKKKKVSKKGAEA